LQRKRRAIRATHILRFTDAGYGSHFSQGH
jgi:hypothetical protein